MFMTRRNALKALVATSATFALPRMAIAFRGVQLDEPVQAILRDHYTTTAVVEDKSIVLDLPALAENGAVVPLTIRSARKDVQAISVFVSANPSPLAATFLLGTAALAQVSTRIKITDSGYVIAVLETPTGHFAVAREIEVTLGACAG